MIAVPILRSERTLRASSDRALARSSSMAVADLVSVTSPRLSISLSWLLAPVAGGLTSTDASPESKQIVPQNVFLKHFFVHSSLPLPFYDPQRK